MSLREESKPGVPFADASTMAGVLEDPSPLNRPDMSGKWRSEAYRMRIEKGSSHCPIVSKVNASIPFQTQDRY